MLENFAAENGTPIIPAIGSDDMRTTICAIVGAVCGYLVSLGVFFAGGPRDDGNPLYLAVVLPLAGIVIWFGSGHKERGKVALFAVGGGLLLWLIAPATSATTTQRIEAWFGDRSILFAPEYAAWGTVLGAAVGAGLSWLRKKKATDSKGNGQMDLAP